MRLVAALFALLLPVASWGATFTIGTTDTFFSCAQEGVADGDTVILANGVHAAGNPSLVVNCPMADGENVTFTNSTDGQAIFRKTGGSGNFVVRCDDCRNITWDGQPWTGMTSGAYCGSAFPGDTAGTDGCGIVIEATGGTPSAYFKTLDHPKNLTLRDIAIQGNGVGIGFSIHEASDCPEDFPGGFVENVHIENTYGTNLGGSHVYMGVNYNDYGCSTSPGHALHTKDGLINNNLIMNTGGGGIRYKVGYQTNGEGGVYDGVIRDNTIINQGTDQDTQGFQVGILCFESSCEIYNNWLDTIGEHGIQFASQKTRRSGASAIPDLRAAIYNNVIIDAGTNNAIYDGHGIMVSNTAGALTNPQMTAQVYQNTVVRPGNDGISYEVNTDPEATARIEGNIFCEAVNAEIDNDPPVDVSDGNTTAVLCSTIGFADLANDDLTLDSGSAAIDAATDGPSTDVLGVARPQGEDFDDGAHEFVVGGGTPPPPNIANKPDCGSYSITADTYSPDHMWMFCEGTGTLVSDEGDNGTDLDLTTDANWQTDASHSGYLEHLNASTHETMSGDSSFSGTIIYGGLLRVGSPDCTDTHMWMTVSDTATDNIQSRVECESNNRTKSVAWNNDTATVNFSQTDITDGDWHFILVRASDTDLDISVDGEAWDEITISKTGLIAALDRIGFGVQGSLTPQFHGDVDWAWAFLERGNFSGATAETLYNSGDWWAQFGVDSGGAPAPPPALSTAVVAADGAAIDLTWDENVVIGAGGNSGVSVTPSGSAIALTFDACATATCSWNFDRTLGSHETLTVSYTNPGNGVEASSGGVDVPDFSTIAVTNNSTQDTVAPLFVDYSFNAAGTQLTVTHDENVTCAGGGTCGYTTTGLASATTLSLDSGSGTTALVFNTSRTVNAGESGTLIHTSGTNLVEDAAGNDLASFSTGITKSGVVVQESVSTRCTDLRFYGGDQVSCPPILSGIGTANLTSTQVDVTFTSDFTGGEATACVMTTDPSTAAQCRACAGGDKASDTTVTAGAQSITVTGLTSSENVYACAVHDSHNATALGWASNMVETAQFTVP